MFLDITAAPEERGTLLDVVERTARRVFVPLTVGGGVRTPADMRAVLRAGADKVAVNTAAVRDPDVIDRCARMFGRQCVVVSIDARASASRRRSRLERRPSGRSDRSAPRWEVVVRGGREATGSTPSHGPERWSDCGAGEILLTSIDRDGTRSGFDLALLRAVSSRVGVPVVASGGAGTPADMVAAIVEGGADAVLAASIFHRDVHSIAAVKDGRRGRRPACRCGVMGGGPDGHDDGRGRASATCRGPVRRRRRPLGSGRARRPRSSRTPPTGAC